MKSTTYLIIALGAVHGAHVLSTPFDDYVKQGANWTYENPGSAGCLAVGGVLIAAPMAAAGLAFTAVGLSSVGPVAGGLFAGAQTAGLVTAGSAFATVQSAAMGGAAAASAVGTILQGLGVATVAGSCGLGSWMGKDDTEEEL